MYMLQPQKYNVLKAIMCEEEGKSKATMYIQTAPTPI